MKQLFDAPLRPYNSFSVEACASRLLVLESEPDLQTLAERHRFDASRDLVLGAGSNTLLVGDVPGTVILNRVTGKRIAAASNDTVLLEVGAGEDWHGLVNWCLDQGLSGIENLVKIPGLAGAAPIQNIGAYGVELAEVLESVQAIDLQNGGFCEFRNEDCGFAYRDSRFKSADAGRYLLTRIRLRLRRNFTPRLDYAGVREELQEMGVGEPSARQVSEAIVRLRRRKLPDPETTPNAGSFFKNPVVSRPLAEQLQAAYRDLPVYTDHEGGAKLSAAWLIERCGWKGRSLGRAAVSGQHALVLVNRANASGRELLDLAEAVRASVRSRFGVDLETELRIVQHDLKP